jgi:hypothetical protein
MWCARSVHMLTRFSTTNLRYVWYMDDDVQQTLFSEGESGMVVLPPARMQIITTELTAYHLQQ